MSTVCEAETARAREFVARKAEETADRAEEYLQSGTVINIGNVKIVESTLKPNANGIFVSVSEEDALAEREQKSPSVEAAKDAAALSAHARIASDLPLSKERVENPERAHDSYDQLSQTV